jgi:hypothetical protein
MAQRTGCQWHGKLRFFLHQLFVLYKDGIGRQCMGSERKLPITAPDCLQKRGIPRLAAFVCPLPVEFSIPSGLQVVRRESRDAGRVVRRELRGVTYARGGHRRSAGISRCHADVVGPIVDDVGPLCGDVGRSPPGASQPADIQSPNHSVGTVRALPLTGPGGDGKVSTAEASHLPVL